ncbi:MAG: hypothetical protein Q8941_23335 [Bacteroidota bacterium]|nr:hypothetical protein [Bacteroidota bacterium]
MAGKKSVLVLVNLVLIVVILYHSSGEYLFDGRPKKNMLVPVCLFSIQLFANTLFYIQQQLFEHIALASFQKKLLIILFPIIIVALFLFQSL